MKPSNVTKESLKIKEFKEFSRFDFLETIKEAVKKTRCKAALTLVNGKCRRATKRPSQLKPPPTLTSEALAHVRGSNLSKALKRATVQIAKVKKKKGELPTVDEFGNVDAKALKRLEDREYRIERGAEEVKGEGAKRLRKSGLRPTSRVSHTEKELEVAGDYLKPRKSPPKKRLAGRKTIEHRAEGK